MTLPTTETRDHLHRIVSATLASLTLEARKDPDGLLYAHGEECFDVRGVGAASIDRIGCILDTVIKALEAKGHAVFNKERKTYVRVGKHEFSVLLSDIHVYRRHVITAKGRLRQKRERLRALPEWDLLASGNLVFRIDSHVSAPRKSWRDGKRQRIEGLLGQIVEGIEAVGHCLQEWENQRERARQARLEQERRSQILQQRRIDENARLVALVKAAEDWDLGKKIDAFVDAVEQNAKLRGEEDNPEVRRWLRWARTKAAKFDPLKMNIPRRKAEWDEPPNFLE